MLTFLKLLKFSTYNNFITIVVLSGSCVIIWLQYAFHSILIKNFFPVISSIENLRYYLHTRYKKAGKDISSLGKIYNPDIGQHYVCKFMSVLVSLYAKLKVLCLQHMWLSNVITTSLHFHIELQEGLSYA